MSSSQSDTLTYVLGALLAAGIAYFMLSPTRDKSSAGGSAEKLSGAEAVLHATDYRKFKLVKKTQVSPNTARYRFELPVPHAVLGLPIGRHIQLMAIVDGKEVARSYTPTSTDNDKGFFELVVKTYPTGVISSHLSRMSIGDTINVRGPRGAFAYTPNMVRAIGMVAGGTGITPMYQIIQHILDNPDDTTHVSVLFANVNEDDILLREELDKWAAKHENFEVHYVLNNPPEEWNGSVGFVTKDMLQKHMPPPANDTKILLCGPPPMVKAMGGCLGELGYVPPNIISKPVDQVFKF
ncbi:NADH-cytochrome b5 reductase [Coemansia sp. RSA 1813]|nr:NADH-cytochrome b5 reductase [Coemansia sp. RSA 1646]KAJ1772251.1 NADH-cytochrome b5 reductase [Coemansia sp. RSA 1843]KAJ2091883.1 NADH-cytochrome b5 reductase [Coemansia sp. RSA 986]KAJ2215791.1 NADH-cytochrome b5 reductase [Coemansia sp. RSA 487]KAJ2571721.1 NADH-cytochrome b5 reductase [Coemansia sp. RSA 1813]